MENYYYKAKHLLTEKVIHGQMSGEDSEAVKSILISQYLYPLKIKKKSSMRVTRNFLRKQIKLSDLSMFCRQFAAMIEAGIPINKALELGAEQTNNKVLKKHLLHMQQKINQGETFSKALEEEKIFPKLLVHMAVCGEVSGNLEKVMKRVVSHLENQLGLRKKVVKAFMYPSLVLALVMIVLIILMVRVVPSYMKLLKDTGSSIPLPTRVVINISHYLSTQWGQVLTGGLLLVGGVSCILHIPYIKKRVQLLMLKVPLVGALKKKQLSVEFASTLSMLVESGVPMLQAMEITRDIMGHAVSEAEMNHALEVLKNGNSVYMAIHSSVIFPSVLISVVKIGEETGKLDEMLKQISKFLKEEVETAVDYMSVFIEPVLISFVALIIGGIMAAIMLPTFSAAISVM